MSVDAATVEKVHLPIAKTGARRLADLLVRTFGCWHAHMGRSITGDGETYRACLDCGARPRFDTQTWMMHGPYYFK